MGESIEDDDKGAINAIEWLNKYGLSLKIGNDKQQTIGHWNINGDILRTVNIARDRIKEDKPNG